MCVGEGVAVALSLWFLSSPFLSAGSLCQPSSGSSLGWGPCQGGGVLLPRMRSSQVCGSLWTGRHAGDAFPREEGSSSVANWESCPIERAEVPRARDRQACEEAWIGTHGGEVGVGTPLRELATSYPPPRSSTSRPLAEAFQNGGQRG